MSLLAGSLTPADLSAIISDLQTRISALESVVKIMSPGYVVLKAANELRIETGTLTMTTDASATFRVGTNLTMRAQCNADFRAGLAMNVYGTTTMTIRGATVNIN
jgi:hypothetical protein